MHVEAAPGLGHSNMSTLAGLRLLDPYQADDATRDVAEIAATYVTERITGPDVSQAREILRKIAATTRSEWVRVQARRILTNPQAAKRPLSAEPS
jgi:hypothetical protein